jgi:hypothetical protein
MWGVFLPVIVDPMMISQMGTSAEPDLGGFHITSGNRIFEIVLEILNTWVGFTRDYAPIRDQNHMTMLGIICSG